MKKVFSLIALSALAGSLVFTSCKKDDDEGGNSPATALVEGTSFSACDQCVVTVGTNIQSTIGFSNTDSESITLTLPNDAEAGTYDLTLDEDASYTASYSNSTTSYTTTSENSSGTLIIESITYDGNQISSMTGTFEFVAGGLVVEEGVISY